MSDGPPTMEYESRIEDVSRETWLKILSQKPVERVREGLDMDDGLTHTMKAQVWLRVYRRARRFGDELMWERVRWIGERDFGWPEKG